MSSAHAVPSTISTPSMCFSSIRSISPISLLVSPYRTLLLYFDIQTMWQVHSQLVCDNLCLSMSASSLQRATNQPPIRQSLQAPYRNAIAHAIDAAALSEPTKLDVDRYYVWRSTPFFVAGNAYYEVTLQHPYYHYPRLERIYPSMRT